ncbi:hypothetical protein [Streptomyces sp. NBC_01744]|uniref:hypothetical protein n=1 Tax=Streptomyces sp. NBC_01744 TaxID=2975927 RepID=UPI003D9A8B75|nr:hypothetical protein OIE70_00140 [Streptomyces sp. NBC_01744]WSF89715.1 hypothetical protein OIE70_45790 [Streptomyces sp. NBC_01744]
MEGLVIILLVLYAATIIGLAAYKGNPWILVYLILPLVPMLLIIAAIAWLFGASATAAVRQETGWKADGSRVYPYHVRKL